MLFSLNVLLNAIVQLILFTGLLMSKEGKQDILCQAVCQVYLYVTTFVLLTVKPLD